MKTLLKSISTLFFILIFSNSLFAKTFTVKYAHAGSADPSSNYTVGANFLKYYLESNSQGRLKVEIYPGGTLGNMRTLIEMVQMGTLELAHSTTSGYGWFFPQIQVLGIPYLFPNDQVAEHVAKGELISDIRKAILKKTKSIRLVGAANQARWRCFFTTKKQIKTASDLEGVKIRTIPAPLQIEMVKYLGGNPTPTPWPEVYTSLASGVLEGLKLAVSDIVTYKMDEFTKYGTWDNHAYLWGLVSANNDWLLNLPKDLQQIIVDGVQKMLIVQQEYTKHLEVLAVQSFVEKSKGTLYMPSTDEQATFVAAKEPMIKWFKENIDDGPMWIDKVNQSISKAEKDIDNQRNDVLN